jgi:hypothetical protein
MNVWGNVKKVTLGGMFVGAMMFAGSLSITGCLTDDKKDDSTATGTKHDLPAATTLSVGAQGHATYGSVIDIDSAKAWTSAVANANQSGIDLVFLFYGDAFHILDAVDAKAAGIAQTPQINLVNTYDNTKIVHVDIVKVTATPADQEAAKAAFDAGTKFHSSAVVAGDMFLVKSTGGKLALVKVASIAGSDKSAAATITLQVNTI